MAAIDGCISSPLQLIGRVAVIVAVPLVVSAFESPESKLVGTSMT